MSDLSSLLKTEIVRLARKAVRADLTAVRKVAAQHRSTIAALRREVDSLKRQLRARNSSSQTPQAAGDEAGSVKRRFSAQRLAKHRASLGLSAQDYGRLVGVSGQSIYKWEAGDVRPRATQIEALASVRALGKRAAAARLGEIATATARPADRPARKRPKHARNTK